MFVLVINCGSSSLKFELFSIDEKESKHTRVARGLVERIGDEFSTLEFSRVGGERSRQAINAVDHGEALRHALKAIEATELEIGSIEAVGHRIVSGADKFVAPTMVNEDIIASLEELLDLAPLHNGPALRAIRAARGVLGVIPMVAVFDTAFHASLPERARYYAIPREIAERYRIRRYGFHGLAHRSM